MNPEPSHPNPIARIIFASRWIQLPIYLGLIVVQMIYAWKFLKALWHLIVNLGIMDENTVMLAVLNLIDVVMIANLLLMVIVGGYETFVSRLKHRQPPRPARMAGPRQRLGAQSQTLDGDYQHLLHPPAANLHQRGRDTGGENPVANPFAPHLPALGAGDGVH